MRDFDTEIVVSLLIILILLGLLSCVPNKETKNENKYETIGKALGTIGNGKK